MTLGKAILRSVVKWLPFLFVPLMTVFPPGIYGVGLQVFGIAYCFMPLITKKQRALHDIGAGTVVIRRKK